MFIEDSSPLAGYQYSIEEIAKRTPDTFVIPNPIPETHKGVFMSIASAIIGFLPKSVLVGLLEKGFQSVEPFVASKAVEEFAKIGITLTTEQVLGVLTAVGTAVETEISTLL